jgi:hypothetical protein
MSKPKPILVVKVPMRYSMYQIEMAKESFERMGLNREYFTIVVTTEKKEVIFETSHYNELGEVDFEKFKQLKQILENEQSSKSGKSK